MLANRTFFFADYEGVRQRQGQVNNLTVPTLAMRNGDFSELSQIIYDPAAPARTPFANNRIPANRIDPIAARYVALFPEPTSTGLANNYASTTIRTQNSTTADVRIDHRFNDNNSVLGRFSYNKSHTVTPPGCPPVNGVYGTASRATTRGSLVRTTRTRTRCRRTTSRIFSPTMIAEVKGGYMKVGIFSLSIELPDERQPDVRPAGREHRRPGVGPGADEHRRVRDARRHPVHPADHEGLHATVPGVAHEDDRRAQPQDGRRRDRCGGSARSRAISRMGPGRIDNQLTRSGDRHGRQLARVVPARLSPTQVQRSHTPFEPHYHTNEPSAFVQDDWRANPG